MIKETVSFSLGMATWPVLEYILHRYSFHGVEGMEGMDNEHLEHHRHPEYYNEGKVSEAMEDSLTFGWPIVAVVGAALTPVVGARAAFPYAAGILARFTVYSKEHLEAHTTAPRSAREARLKKHHLIHHFKFPKDNFGVTTTLMDDLMGTSKTVDVLKIPARMAPKWLIDDPEKYADDYQLIGLDRLAEDLANMPKKQMRDRMKLTLKDLVPVLKKAG